MKTETYEIEDRVVEHHWWFVCRRRLFARLIRGLGLDAERAVVDVGTSSGTNLILLGELGFRNVSGLDVSPEAVAYCARRGLPPVRLGSAEAMPFADGTVDLLLATDVLEHLADDRAALVEMERVLVPGGRVLITVPAFPSLWGLQDEVSLHLRRYRHAPLLVRLRAAGFEIEQSFHFNFLLFAPIWLARQILRRLRPRVASENEINAPWLNRVLTGVFGLDVRLAPRLRPPFGVSILVLARKPLPDR